MSEISFWLDYYDDIFSDFDPRSYHKRRVSEDFLDELKAALKYHKDHTESLALLLPRERRNEELEPGIIKQVKEQLQFRLLAAQKKQRRIVRRGLTLFLAGLIFMYVDSLAIVKSGAGQGMIMLRILLEPASWFMLWTGLDSLFYDYRNARPETKFYKTVCSLNIRFDNV